MVLSSWRKPKDAKDAIKGRMCSMKSHPLKSFWPFQKLAQQLQHPYLRMWYGTIFYVQYVALNFLLVKVLSMGLKILKSIKLFSNLFAKLIQVFNFAYNFSIRLCFCTWEIFMCACILRMPKNSREFHNPLP